ncbi:MAG: caspase domain-containing protein [Labrys sp. (in: a-proteobacteria)]
MVRSSARAMLWAVAAAFALVVAAQSPAKASKSVAFIVGNDRYENVPELQKAVNDARAISARLEQLGFVIHRYENLDQRAMSRALASFDNAVGPGDRVVFFFSGHGFEIGGSNYLLPTDVPEVQNANQLPLIRDASFAVDAIVDRLRQRGAGISILILDACRDNPFAGPGTRSTAATRGLARVEAPEGVFVLMSAGAKQMALDRLSDEDADPNSVFTRTFLKELEKPDQTLVQIAKRTQVKVKALAAKIGHEQTPAYYDQVIGDVVLGATDPAAGETATDTQADAQTDQTDAQTADAGAADDATNVSDNVETQINTAANTQLGAGVSAGTGVQIGAGVIIGGKDAKLAVEDPANAPKLDPAGAETKLALLPANPGLGSGLGAGDGTGGAPIANFMRSNAGWTVTFSLPEPATAIEYRVGETGDFRETGLLDILDQRTGQRMPNPSVQLSGKAKAGMIFVRYRTADGGVLGPFPIRFDPDIALFDMQKKTLEQLWPTWVEFREYEGLLIYFTTMISYRCAITEIRYGLNGAEPLKRHDLPPCDTKNPYNIPDDAKIYIKVPEDTTSISLQVTWRDGTKSEINTIEK